jgi:hypothetical protein
VPVLTRGGGAGRIIDVRGHARPYCRGRTRGVDGTWCSADARAITVKAGARRTNMRAGDTGTALGWRTRSQNTHGGCNSRSLGPCAKPHGDPDVRQLLWNARQLREL